MKSKIVSILSSIGALIMGSCGGACGVACIAGGCCGGSALFGLIGLSGTTLYFLDKLKPLFLVITIFSLSYAFYRAYKPKNVECCNTTNDINGDACCAQEKKTTFFQSKSFLWATTILCAIMWLYPHTSKLSSGSNSNTECCPSSGNIDTIIKEPIIFNYSWEKNKDTITKTNP